MRYIKKQPHLNTCGIVAIVNVLRSFGVNVSYKQILKEAGGLKKVGKRGMHIMHVMKILRKHNVECMPTQVPRKKMLKLAAHPKATVMLAYVWLKRITKTRMGGGPHIVMVQKNGKALNSNKQSAIIGQRWRDTRAIWGFSPVTLVCLPLKGGAK